MVIPISFAITTFTTTSSTNNLDSQSYKKILCDKSFHVKMFDDKIIPKYIIGKGYKITSVNPTTTGVLVSKCTLKPNII
jgi:hypothetical protein